MAFFVAVSSPLWFACLRGRTGPALVPAIEEGRADDDSVSQLLADRPVFGAVSVN